jgi:hypothetical protein
MTDELDQIDQIAAALAVAQAKMPNASLNKVNPHYKSKYADLSSVRDACLPHLTANGISVVNFMAVDDNGNLMLHTRLLHKSGQFLESLWPVSGGTDQQRGSSISYGRRYNLSGLTGITSEEDDDGNMASAAPKKSASKARADGDYQTIVAAIQAAPSVEALQKVWLENMGAIKALPDSWQAFVRESKEVRKIELTEGVGEDGKATFKQRLAASAAAEDDA